MALISEAWALVQVWGGGVGLAFDIAGAILVYQGVRTSLDEAQRIETPIVPKTLDDIGGDNIRDFGVRVITPIAVFRDNETHQNKVDEAV